ncbi:MAG: hypothetical protein ABI614_05640 [Planctomycetota bacterium]
MVTKMPTRLPAKPPFPRVMLLVRVLVHVCIVSVAALFPCATPSLGLFHVNVSTTESEAPADQDNSSETEAISVQIRARFGGTQSGLPLKVAARCGVRVATVNIASLPQSGHRLANHLLAPLRC